MRIDKLLWFLRLTKTRGLAQALVEEGHIRRNGSRIERAAQAICVGDILVLPIAGGVRVVEILGLPGRRGPASEAQGLYRVLDETRKHPIAAPTPTAAIKGDLQP